MSWNIVIFVKFILIVFITPNFCYPLSKAIENNFKCSVPFQGKCVPLAKCPSIYKALEYFDNLSEIHQKNIKSSQCGVNGSAQDPKEKVLVCCPHSDIENDHSSLDLMLAQSIHIDNLQCGVTSPVRINDDATDKVFDHYPWMALIEYEDIRDNRRRGFNCTGSLINNRFVLTAAHCVNDRYWKAKRVLLGNWNSKTSADCLKSNNVSNCIPSEGYIFEIQTIFSHSKFPSKMYHDIALIKLRDTVTFSNFVRPICLPFRQSMPNIQLSQQVAKYISWGQTRDESVILNRRIDIPLRIWETAKCQRRYRNMDLNIHRTHHICAGGEQNVDTCKGDSGGALMYGLDNGFMRVHYLIGVMVAGTDPCGIKDWPNISVNVQSHLQWILNYLAES